MAWQEWVAILASGTASAIIGLVGVFIAFKLTTRQETRESRAARTSGSVAAIVTASMTLPRHLAGWRFVVAELSVVDFVEASQLFVANEAREHPAVSAWVLVRCEHVVEVFSHQGGLKRPLWLRRQTMNALARHMGETAGALVSWNAGRNADSWFAERRDGRADAPSR